MKLMVLVVVFVSLTGCASGGPLRTGKVCLTPIDSTDCSTSNPIDVRSDVVLKVASMLQAEMIALLGQDSEFSYTTDCSTADFVLVTKLKSLDAKSEMHRGFFHVDINREYSMSAIAHLDDFNKNLVVSNIFEEVHDNDNLSHAINDVAKYIIRDAKEWPKTPKP